MISNGRVANVAHSEKAFAHAPLLRFEKEKVGTDTASKECDSSMATNDSNRTSIHALPIYLDDESAASSPAVRLDGGGETELFDDATEFVPTLRQ